jgi:hypothetical protein
MRFRPVLRFKHLINKLYILTQHGASGGPALAASKRRAPISACLEHQRPDLRYQQHQSLRANSEPKTGIRKIERPFINYKRPFSGEDALAFVVIPDRHECASSFPSQTPPSRVCGVLLRQAG